MHDLFVFCGQSNMMGAASIPPEHKLNIKNSFEYKFKNKYLGIGQGHFSKVSFACMIPYFCEHLEKSGRSPLIAHIAKGCTSITHYFNEAMAIIYNRLCKTSYKRKRL